MLVLVSRIASIAATLLLIAPLQSAAQTDVLTNHNDNMRTGANLSEAVLTTSNVTVSQFGKLFERVVDDQIYAQPLIVTGVDISGAQRNMLYVATVNNSVYAFDADDPAASAPIWQVNYNNPAAGIVPVKNSDFGTCYGGPFLDFTGNMGIVGTPVIDRSTSTMYFVARTKENGTFVQRLHALDVRNGNERPGSPIRIQATVPGTGDGHDAQNNVAFDSRTQNQRPALTLSDGVVYIAWASQCDLDTYHGWIVGYDAATLQQVMVYNTSPNGGLGGIEASQGLSVDGAGNLYAVTANGPHDETVGGPDSGSSFLKINPAGQLLDWFTPYNWATLNSNNLDLGIHGALLVPGTSLVVGAGKQSVFYVVDRNNMGHLQAGSDSQIIQSFQASTGRMWGSPVYWNSPVSAPTMYVWPAGEPIKAFRLVNGRFQTTPTKGPVASPTGMPGGILSVSANGNALGTGIVWAAMSNAGSAGHATQPGILRAYDASDVTRELWNSQQNATRDSLGNFAKFVPPTIANGKVYMATFSQKIVVYGLLGGTTPANAPPTVDAGPDQTVTLPNTAALTGSATDDGNPVPPGGLTTQWTLVSGPAPVSFSAQNSLNTVVTFTTSGIYTLQLSATDGALTTTDRVTITVNPSSESSLPSGWQTTDIGNVGIAGSGTATNGTFTLQGSGADIWGTADAFRFVYYQLPGDGQIVARVATVQNVNAWTKAGVMIRQSLAAGSPHASMFVTPAKGLAFQRRKTADATSLSTSMSGGAPMWVKLVRAGQTVTASVSSNGATWTKVSQDTIALSGAVYAGLALTSHDASRLASATVDNVTVTLGGLPSGWATTDIGSVGIAGSATAVDGTFTVRGAGADIWGTADAFRFVYYQLPGDGQIVARVATVQNVNAWTKAGVMIRQSLAAGSPHASMFVTPGKGLAFQRRQTAGAVSLNTSITGAAPMWVKLVRTGQTVTASVSSDGVTWTTVGQDTIGLSGPVYAGLAVTSHDASRLASATIDNVK